MREAVRAFERFEKSGGSWLPLALMIAFGLAVTIWCVSAMAELISPPAANASLFPEGRTAGSDLPFDLALRSDVDALTDGEAVAGSQSLECRELGVWSETQLAKQIAEPFPAVAYRYENVAR